MSVLVPRIGMSVAAATIAHLGDPKVRRNIALRQTIVQEMRSQLVTEGFAEYDTPLLAARIDEYTSGHFRTESARGDEFWLTQSPQLFKQLLMASGCAKYMQFAHCFRDEAPEAGRYDRMREFIQLDLEMATTDPAEVRRTIERALHRVAVAVGREMILPFPELDAVTALETYGTDRPDLRTSPDEWSFVWVTGFPLAERDHHGKPRLVRHPMAKPVRMPADAEEACVVPTLSYDLVVNGYEIGSGDIRIHDPAEQAAVLRMFDLPVERFRVLLDGLATCPPHGGAGIGLDRLTMALAGSRDIVDVSAFPHWFGCIRPEDML